MNARIFMDFNIFKKYFFLNLKDYPNIGVDIYINQVILIFTVGIIIASFLINYNRTGINLIVKRMLRKKALTAQWERNIIEAKERSCFP